VTLNTGNWVNGGKTVDLKAEARTPQEVSLIADWDTMMNYVISQGNHVVPYTGNKPDITVIASTVVSRGGEILIAWSHYGRSANDGRERDGGFALLLDDDGKIVGSAHYMMPQNAGNAYSTGHWVIKVPDSGFERTYKLVLASYDGGDTTRNSTVDSHLDVDNILMLNHDFSGPSHSGNLIKDRGVDGLVDEAWDEARVGVVTVNGTLYAFPPGEDVKTIVLDEGTLYVGTNGDYFFKPSSGTFSGLEFTYQLVDRDGDWSNKAHVRLGATGETPTPLAYDNVAQVMPSSSGSAQAGNMLRDAGADGGSIDVVSEQAVVSSITYAGQTYNLTNGSVTVATTGGGQLRVESDGDYTFTSAPGGGEGVADRFTYTVSDNGKTDTATVYLFSDDMRAHGTGGNDLIDHAHGFKAEMIDAGAGNDTVYGGTGDDVIFGQAGNDLIYGGEGNDTIYGGTGDDVIRGEEGNDVIYGGDGDNIIFGGAGDDLIYGGAGNNTLYGGAGNDTFTWDQASFKGISDRIMDFSADDKLRFSDLLEDAKPETLLAFLDDNVSIDLERQDIGERTLLITVRDGVVSKDVEITFDQSNTDFDQFKTTYNGATDDVAKEAALRSFLQSICEG
jgi:Ca2+-binding RTX toxin-like protein